MAEAPAGAEVGAGVSQAKQVPPYANCKNLGAMRWLLMNYQGNSVRPYSLRALAYVSPIVALAAVLAVGAACNMPGWQQNWLLVVQLAAC
jgi:hypothetical protein